jgi:hypothetical protein
MTDRHVDDVLLALLALLASGSTERRIWSSRAGCISAATSLASEAGSRCAYPALIAIRLLTETMPSYQSDLPPLPVEPAEHAPIATHRRYAAREPHFMPSCHIRKA